MIFLDVDLAYDEEVQDKMKGRKKFVPNKPRLYIYISYFYLIRLCIAPRAL